MSLLNNFFTKKPKPDTQEKPKAEPAKEGLAATSTPAQETPNENNTSQEKSQHLIEKTIKTEPAQPVQEESSKAEEKKETTSSTSSKTTAIIKKQANKPSKTNHPKQPQPNNDRLQNEIVKEKEKISKPLPFQISIYGTQEIRKIYYGNKWYFSLYDIINLSHVPNPSDYIAKAEKNLKDTWNDITKEIAVNINGEAQLLLCTTSDDMIKIIWACGASVPGPFPGWLKEIAGIIPKITEESIAS